MEYTQLKPFAHQKKAVAFLKEKPQAALFMEMGTGKTKCVIDYIEHCRVANDLRKILIIAPNSILDNEQNEFLKHLPDNVIKTWYDIRVLRGVKNKKIRDIETIDDEKCTVLIINYESVRTVFNELRDYNAKLIILDESTKVKNPRAQQSKAVQKLGQFCRNKIIMTGTPVTNSYIDIYSQYKFLCPDIFGTSYIAFRSKYCVMGGFQFRQIIKYVNVEELIKKIRGNAMFCLKKDCLDLPDKVYKTFNYELTDEQRRVYNGLKNEMIAEYKTGQVSVSQAIVKILRLQQICSGFLQLDERDKVTHFEDNPKLELLESIMAEYDIPKAVIWCRYIAEIKMLEKWAQEVKMPAYTFYGGTPQNERLNVVKKFNETKRAVFIGQVHTGGMGINLTSADICIYYSNNYSLEDRAQSEDRLHRIGQKNKVTYIDLTGRNTLESSILKALQKKQKLADIITQNKEITSIIDGI